MVTINLCHLLAVTVAAMLACGAIGLYFGQKIGRMQGLMEAVKIAVVDHGAAIAAAPKLAGGSE